ncbi:hypothetical protein P154DRAFT_574831 [Amniculicola lignicola CBS 123094]|uniref:AAA+ ATPase lid domain-containing protein n=1 Tax=Amniculicola lignicola CBS 123094 TaxID=1392246 RepID=A0A6A5WKN4_9PLEO|nr:hypothetical protein P154DRAFT_574831 [Amniculicola lignicola CBS 123094]
MEYYKGMLFLTTNRIEQFDPAFHNRVHVNIKYGELSPEERCNIWRDHLTRACKKNRNKALWNEEAYRLLGSIKTNGRDIRNSTRTAVNFAQSSDHDVDMTHVLTVVRNNFNAKTTPDLEKILEELEQLHERLSEQTDLASEEQVHTSL